MTPEKLSEAERTEIESRDVQYRESFMHSGACMQAIVDRHKLLEDHAALRAENERLKRALAKQSEEVCQILGRSLGYPRFCDDQKNFPGSTEADGVCVGEHIAETLAAEASERLSSAQQRLAALKVDPAKRDELVAVGFQKFRESFNAAGVLSSISVWPYQSVTWRRAFADGVDAVVAVVSASRPEVADLQRQLDELTKQLAELTEPEDEIELRKIAWANYGSIYAQQKGELLESYESSTPERRARIDKAADAVAARVRAPLLQQIAELQKAFIDEYGIAKAHRLAAELAEAKQALADARGELERMRGAIFEGDDDRPSLYDTLKRAQGDGGCRISDHYCDWLLHRLKSFISQRQSSPAKAAASEPIGLCPKCGIQTLTKDCGDMIRLGEKDYVCGNCKRYLCLPIESNPAASEPVDHSGEANEIVEPSERRFVCPKCGGTEHEPWSPQPAVGKSVRCTTQTAQGKCGVVYDVATEAEVEAAKGEGEDRKTPELIFTAGPLRNACQAGWHSARGEASLVLPCAVAARDEAQKIVDEATEARDAKARLGIVPGSSETLREKLDGLRQQLAAERQAREAAEKRLEIDWNRFNETWNSDQQQRQATEKLLGESIERAERLETELAGCKNELLKDAACWRNECGLRPEKRELYERWASENEAAAAGEAGAKLLKQLTDEQENIDRLTLENDELKQRAEHAEAAAVVMREACTSELVWGHASVLEVIQRASTRENHSAHTWAKGIRQKFEAALATDPGRAANELRSYKKFATKIMHTMVGGWADCHKLTMIRDAVAELDHALSHGEQRREGR